MDYNTHIWIKFILSIILLIASLFFFYFVVIRTLQAKHKEIKRIKEEIIPFFNMLKVEYGAKSPTMMYNIESTLPELMPEDNGNTCIFIANDCLVIRSLIKDDLNIEIPKESLRIASTLYFENSDYFYIYLVYYSSNIQHKIAFDTIQLTKKLNKRLENELSPNELVKFVKQCREYIQTKHS